MLTKIYIWCHMVILCHNELKNIILVYLTHWGLGEISNVFFIVFLNSKVLDPARFNTLRPRQNRGHFTDDIFKWIFLNENVWIPIKISLKFVPKDQINNIVALVQIMACRRSGDKPLSETMIARLPTHICFAWPQWVKQWPCDLTSLLINQNEWMCC